IGHAMKTPGTALFNVGNTQNRTRSRITALLSALVLLASPAAAFDTDWHSQCSQKVGEQCGFKPDPWKIMQLGDFSPESFGPIAEYASKKMPGKEIEELNQSLVNNPQIRGAALFLHFDNLNSELQSNSNFDYLFIHFLQSTQNLLAEYHKLQVDE